MSVMMQAELLIAVDAANSSADSNPRASWPNERINPTRAPRRESSSSMIEISCPDATRSPSAVLSQSCILAELIDQGNHTQVLRTYPDHTRLCVLPGKALRQQRSGRPEVQQFGHTHQIGERARAHFSHRSTAMNFYRDLAQAEIARNLLIQLAGSHQDHDLLLAG